MTTPRRVLPTLALLFLASSASAQTTPSQPSKTSGTTAKPAAGASKPETPSAPSASTPPGAETTPDPKETKDEHAEEEGKRAIYISSELGFTRVDVGGLSNDLGFNNTAANGVMYGVAAGLRMKDMRYGLRWRVWDTTEYALWGVSASIGYGLPIRPLSPIFSLHVGYAWDQKVQRGAYEKELPILTALPPNVDLQGIVAGLDVNASYWVTPFLRLGMFIGADFYYLLRPQVDLPQVIFGSIPPETRRHPLFTEDGSGLGFAFNVGFRGAFDIAF